MLGSYLGKKLGIKRAHSDEYFVRYTRISLSASISQHDSAKQSTLLFIMDDSGSLSEFVPATRSSKSELDDWITKIQVRPWSPSNPDNTLPTLESITARVRQQSYNLKALHTAIAKTEVQAPQQPTHVFIIVERYYIKRKILKFGLAGIFSTVEAANEQALMRFREHMQLKEDEDLSSYAKGSFHRCITLDGKNGKEEGFEIQAIRQAVKN